MLRRINIKPHHVMQLVDELGIIRELELSDAMRLQPVGVPDALHRACADALLPRHHGYGPVGGLGRRISLRESHHAAAMAAPSSGMREGRVLSRRRPAPITTSRCGARARTHIFARKFLSSLFGDRWRRKDRAGPGNLHRMISGISA